MNQEELEACLSKWQKILRLQDWNVHVEVKRERDMEMEGRCAELSCQEPTRHAWIVIRDPTDYPDTAAEPQDMEMSIVHELLHIYTRPFDLPGQGPKHIAEEWLIEAVCHALVRLSRQG